MSTNEMFDGFDQTQYEEEARQRWGNTKEFQESTARAKKYSKQDWDRIKQQSGEINSAIAGMMDRDPADPDVQIQVGRWHQMITDSFYTCSPQVFRGLGEMYVGDSRFTATYDKVKPGLAHFLRDAMNVYCDNLEAVR